MYSTQTSSDAVTVFATGSQSKPICSIKSEKSRYFLRNQLNLDLSF